MKWIINVFAGLLVVLGMMGNSLLAQDLELPNKVFQEADDLYQQGEFYEVLKVLDDLEPYSLDLDDRMRYEILRSDAFLQLSWLDSVQACADAMSKLQDQPGFENWEGEYFFVLGNLAAARNQYKEASDYFQQANLIFAQAGKQVQQAKLYENVGLFYLDLKDFAYAYRYLKQAYDLFIKLEDVEPNLNLVVNMGVAAFRVDSFEMAEQLYLKAIQMGSQSGSPFQKARALSNLANLYRKLNNEALSLKYFDEALSLCKEHELAVGIAINHLNRSELFLNLGKYREAQEDIEIAEPIVEGLNSQTLKVALYESKARLFLQLGDSLQSYRFFRQYVALQDSMRLSDNRRIVEAWQTRFEQERLMRELAERDEDIAKAKLRGNLSFFGGLFVIIVLVALIIILIYARRQHLLKEEMAEKEKQSLMREVELNKKELTSKALSISSIEESKANLKKKLIQVVEKLPEANQWEFVPILKELDKDDSTSGPWKELQTRFEQVHDDFYKRLNELANDLTPVELKVASFIRLNLSSKEISQLTKRSLGTVLNVRSSLRKKLNLTNEENLTSFLVNL